MTEQSPTEIRDHLSAKLMETASNLERDQVLPTSEIATAFVMVGATIIACHKGPVGAAEHLRDLADMIERDDKSLNSAL